MKSKIVFIALALFSAQVNAGWVFIDENDEGTKFYIDISTKHKQGIYTYVWSMQNYANSRVMPPDKYYKSIKVLFVFKCNEMQFGANSFLLYSESSATGSVVHSDNRELSMVEFNEIVPESSGMKVYKAACGDGK